MMHNALQEIVVWDYCKIYVYYATEIANIFCVFVILQELRSKINYCPCVLNNYYTIIDV